MMMQVRVISMPGLVRRNRARQRLTLLGWPWKFIDGVDVRGWSSQELDRVCDQQAIQQKFGRLANLGEIGCALAHQHAWIDFLASNEASTVILEEDAIPGPDFETRLRGLATLCDEQVEMILLYTGCAVVYAESQRTLGSITISRCAGRADHALAYWVTRQAALQLLAAQTPRIRALADWPLPLSHLKAYVSHQPWVTHDSHDSIIDPMRNKRWVGLRFLWRTLKQCLTWNKVGMHYHLHDLVFTRLLRWRSVMRLQVIAHPKGRTPVFASVAPKQIKP